MVEKALTLTVTTLINRFQRTIFSTTFATNEHLSISGQFFPEHLEEKNKIDPTVTDALLYITH